MVCCSVEVPIDFVLSTVGGELHSNCGDYGGKCIENASLYDQSHRVIEDLQLVNETSKKLNSNMPFDEMISFLKQQLLRAFKPMETAFVFYDETGGYTISPLSTNFF